MELVVANKDVHYKEILDAGIMIHFLVRKYTRKDPTLFYRFLSVVWKFKPDIIHVWGGMTAVYALPARLLLGKTLVNSQIADAPNRVKRRWLGYWCTFRFSDVVIANSNAGLRAYGISKSKGVVIHNGFDFGRLASLQPAEDVRRQLMVSTPYIVGMVASFTIRKDYKTYLEAARMLLDQRKDITFLCVGEGTPPRDGFDDRYRPYIKVLTRRSDIESLMNICDVGVLATNLEAHGEGISNALMEFMALGKPVIGTDGGGTPELIHNGANGLLMRNNDADDLASKILFLIRHARVREQMGMKARQTVEHEFNMKKMTERFLQIYDALV